MIFVFLDEKTEEQNYSEDDFLRFPGLEKYKCCEQIFGHKCIISHRCDVLSVMLASQMKEGQTGICVMRDVKSSVFKSLLGYVYSGSLFVSPENVIGLMLAAGLWQLNHLKYLCEVRMIRYLTLNNAIDTLITAHTSEAYLLYDEWFFLSFLLNIFLLFFLLFFLPVSSLWARIGHF